MESFLPRHDEPEGRLGRPHPEVGEVAGHRV
jgi:hypothetical protein